MLVCFMAGLYNSATVAVNALHETHSQDHADGFSLITMESFCQVTQTETIRGLNNHPVTPLRNHLNVFLACTKDAELAILNSYSKYFFYAKNTITCFCKTDVIFPFHYFW